MTAKAFFIAMGFALPALVFGQVCAAEPGWTVTATLSGLATWFTGSVAGLLLLFLAALEAI